MFSFYPCSPVVSIRHMPPDIKNAPETGRTKKAVSVLDYYYCKRIHVLRAPPVLQSAVPSPPPNGDGFVRKGGGAGARYSPAAHPVYLTQNAPSGNMPRHVPSPECDPRNPISICIPGQQGYTGSTTPVCVSGAYFCRGDVSAGCAGSAHPSFSQVCPAVA